MLILFFALALSFPDLKAFQLTPLVEFMMRNRVAKGLTALRPLRTVRDSFPSYSSSPLKTDHSRPIHLFSIMISFFFLYFFF